MRKFMGLLVAIAGGAVVAWAGSSLLFTHESVYGFDPVYAGVGGCAILVAGLALRSD